MKTITGFIAVLLLPVFTAFTQDKFDLVSVSVIKVTGTSTLHDWEVVSNEVAGNLMFIQKGKTKKNQSMKGKISAGELMIAVESLKSERGETMNGKMHRALKYEDYPQVTFQLTDLINLDPSKETEVSKISKGMLTIAGIKKRIEISVNVSSVTDTISVKGSKKIQLSDFEIKPPSAMFGQIETGNDIVISFDLKYSK